MLKRISIAAVIAWVSAALLGLLFAVCVSERPLLDALSLPGVVPVTLLASTGVTVLLTPLVMWALKSGKPSLTPYGVALFALLAIYIALVTPAYPGFGLYGSIAVAIIGLVAVGLAHLTK